MRYHNITKDDMLNGDGLRVVLWVSGCDHCCKECHNPITWDPNGGLVFDKEAKEAAQFLYENPDYKVLFDASRKVKKEDIDFVKQMIDRMTSRGDD